MSVPKLAPIIFALILLAIPASALWTIQDPDYSGYVVFQDQTNGYAHIQYGPIAYNQDFTYTEKEPGTYIASFKFLNRDHSMPFTHSGDIITSQARPNSKLVWWVP